MCVPSSLVAATMRRCSTVVTARWRLGRPGLPGWSLHRGFAKNENAPVHIPVMLDETVGLWEQGVMSTNSHTNGSRFFVDGTTGFGGHSRALLARNPDAQLLCIDRDPEILAVAKANLHEYRSRVAFANGSYADIATHLRSAGFPERVAGILVDLGANSFHFDEARRGFSWLHDGPLDMRFDQRSGAPTAADVLNSASEVELTRIFKQHGEERLAKEYAKAIIRERDERNVTFRTTHDLRDCIERIANIWSLDKKSGKKNKKKDDIHAATRCFQALRIHVNDELVHVEEGVKSLARHIAPGGRLVTIAFHSLEDRPIKELFRTLDAVSRDEDKRDEVDDQSIHELLADSRTYRMVKRKAIKATQEEIEQNPRSRSARLRCLEALT
ncbi:TPA: hypothetical protein N0F65_004726 [Lagenidium giganteum]|uniref:Uncharacterized protein n=1 Tax=Lagenidium giganteum TaxID=4803 RepID=A0AAV2Z0G9_9STRA|nr:TPA: hypothetical protein N0F65_004726 [Lagenidium giganteum]